MQVDNSQNYKLNTFFLIFQKTEMEKILNSNIKTKQDSFSGRGAHFSKTFNIFLLENPVF